MIGSLGQFITTSNEQCFKQVEFIEDQVIPRINKAYHRQRNSVSEYKPQDKSIILKNFSKNRQQYYQNTMQKNKGNVKSQKIPYRGKSPYQHSSFFVQPEILKDYIAKDTLQRKHNLLRAIVRSKQDEYKTNQITDYDQSFQRMVSGYSQIYVKPGLKIDKGQENKIKVDIYKNLQPQKIPAKKSLQVCQRIIQYKRCRDWAKKHRKDYSYYDKKLDQSLDKRVVEKKKSDRRQYMSQLTNRISEYDGELS